MRLWGYLLCGFASFTAQLNWLVKSDKIWSSSCEWQLCFRNMQNWCLEVPHKLFISSEPWLLSGISVTWLSLRTGELWEMAYYPNARISYDFHCWPLSVCKIALYEHSLRHRHQRGSVVLRQCKGSWFSISPADYPQSVETPLNGWREYSVCACIEILSASLSSSSPVLPCGAGPAKQSGISFLKS